MRTFISSACALLAVASVASANIITVVDNAPAGATVEGTVNAGGLTLFAGTHTEVQLDGSQIGVTVCGPFRYVQTYIFGSGFRSDEFHGVGSFGGGSPGFAPSALGSGNFNNFTTVPEPCTLALMGLGAAGLLARRYRRTRAL
jgi:hypothetical protein